MACKQTGCGRWAYSRGWYSSHYRRWRSGQPMDTPIRSYASSVRPKREKPFAAEYALLAELGLRRGLTLLRLPQLSSEIEQSAGKQVVRHDVQLPGRPILHQP
jgi:hypothetical protein